MNVNKYRKSIIVGVVAFLTAVAAALTDSRLTGGEVSVILVQVLTALGVYTVPNGE